MSKSNGQTGAITLLYFLTFVSEIFKTNVYEISHTTVQLFTFLIQNPT